MNDTAEKPEVKFWVEVDPETYNPTGNVCWSYYPDDKPAVGFWIEMAATGVTT